MTFRDPFEALIGDLGATFRPQREWVQRRGLLLILAHFLTGVGAGSWLFSLIFGLNLGLILGLLLVAIGGLAHLGFLGRMWRFWRIVVRVQSSWVSRGLVGIALFGVTALLYLILTLLQAEETALARAMMVLSVLGAAWILTYKGLVWAVCKAIPFWNTALLPALYIAYALRGGAAILLVGVPMVGKVVEVELLELWIAASCAALILLYVTIMASAGVTARRSVSELLGGRASLAFYLGVVLFGLVVPIAIGVFGYFTALASPLLMLVGISSLIGDFYTIYCIAKAGIYRPLLGEFPAAR